MQKLTRWTRLRASAKLTHLHRDDADLSHVFPSVVRNTRDNSVLVLVTDEKGQPRRFKDEKGGEYLLYADATKVTNRQYVKFLNEVKENRVQGGVPWLEFDFRYCGHPRKARRDGHVQGLRTAPRSASPTTGTPSCPTCRGTGPRRTASGPARSCRR